MTEATILHADLDAFYAAVEQLLDPRLRGRPIAVGGGVVLAASYEAKVFGVHGGMSASAARRRCPSLRFVPGHFRDYVRIGDAVMDILGGYTPDVERISIDEAFLDVAGSVHLFGSPARIAAAVRERVRTEVGLPISVGVARTKHLAKIASQVAKPDGLVVVEPDAEEAFLHPLPVELMWGVGPVTRRRLAEQTLHLGREPREGQVAREDAGAGRMRGATCRGTEARAFQGMPASLPSGHMLKTGRETPGAQTANLHAAWFHKTGLQLLSPSSRSTLIFPQSSGLHPLPRPSAFWPEPHD